MKKQSLLKHSKISYICISLLLVTCKTTKTPSTTTPDTTTKTPPTTIKKDSMVTDVRKLVLPPLSEEDSLDLKIGQMIMIGINNAKTISGRDSIVAEIVQNKVGGIILFEKNVSNTNSYTTLKSCIDSLQKNAKVPLFVSIDEEGGQVHRLKEKYGFVKMPSAMYLGKIDNVDSTYYYNAQLASQLKSLGINMNYAPCLDMAVNKSNPVIYKLWRSYSQDPEMVTKHAKVAIEAHQQNHVATVVKHFPGHGSSSTDSHLGLTDVTKTWGRDELIPFANLIKSDTYDAFMTAHIVNCKLDSSCLPATLSKKIITGLLRDSLKYNGVIITDDMQMYAISKNYGLENAISLSINAGVDMLLVGNNVIATQQMSATQLHKIIKKLVKNGKIPKQRISESYQRITKLKTKLKLL